MKYERSLVATTLTILIMAICPLTTHSGEKSEQASTACLQECPANPDGRYSRHSILEQLARMLNDSIPEYKSIYSAGFYVDDEGAATFDAYDLVDVTNIESVRAGRHCIKFINNHVYHVYPADYGFSFSHIAILEDGNLKVFKSINCKGRGDTLDDVIAYLKQKGVYDREILERVRRYREYGVYTRTDDYTRVRCEEADRTKR
jgi:hypothetical protein